VVQPIGRGCDEDLIGGLRFPPAVRGDDPAQARTGGINAERVIEILATEVFGGRRCGANASNKYYPGNQNVLQSIDLHFQNIISISFGKKSSHRG
jgi:hypothetical protein